MSTALNPRNDTKNNAKNLPNDLKGLLNHPDLWQAGKLAPQETTISSGFASLDESLPGNGWPEAGLAEFLLGTQGIGELQLLIPLLKHLSHAQERWIVWVNPPHLPYAPALAEHGINLDKILLIHPKNHKDALWALECATKSGTCSVALAWLDEKRLSLKDTRRLQLAAKTGNTFTCLFRPQRAAVKASMAELRVSVKPLPATKNATKNTTKDTIKDITHAAPNRVQVCIEKRRRGWPTPALPIQLQHAPHVAIEQQQAIQEQLNLWRAMELNHGNSSAAVANNKHPHTHPLQSQPLQTEPPRQDTVAADLVH